MFDGLIIAYRAPFINLALAERPGGWYSLFVRGEYQWIKISLALVYIPKIVAPIRQLSDSMEQIEASFDEAERVLSSFDEKTIDQFKQTMESLNETSQQARVFMEKLKDSGLDKLQSTIEGLSSSLNTFLKLFGR